MFSTNMEMRVAISMLPDTDWYRAAGLTRKLNLTDIKACLRSWR